ncbi:MAG TPA: hypothetical protein VGD30_16065 [Telluria sp.]
MKIPGAGVAKRLIFSLLLAGSLGGCAYYGPPGAYDPYPYSYGAPVYVGPPVSLDLGFGFYDYGRSYHRGHQHGHRVQHYRGHRGGVHHGNRGFGQGGRRWR